jgi:HEAT repeat protein
MARLSLKPDSSFFKKIVVGAVGSRAVCNDLNSLGHNMIELERGSTDTKIWKEVKRKRVRIPDLVCTNCGIRVESRAKTSPMLAMSHSDDFERNWDYGMVDDDLIAFPVTNVISEEIWSIGKLIDGISEWNESNILQWNNVEHINYFDVKAFRTVSPNKSSTKGVTEGSETSLVWDAIFSTKNGIARIIDDYKIKVIPPNVSNDRAYTWTNKNRLPIVIEDGQKVKKGQILASNVKPKSRAELMCNKSLSTEDILRLINSREKTLRYTGVKLARVNSIKCVEQKIYELALDQEEDLYVRLEAISYLAYVHSYSLDLFISPYLEHNDEQIQLEAVITLSEIPTEESVELLSRILDELSGVQDKYFLCSAAAWSLSIIGTDTAIKRLVKAFSDINEDLREEALEGIKRLGHKALSHLIDNITNKNEDIIAGCAEALRKLEDIDSKMVDAIIGKISDIDSENNKWIAWLLGNLPKDVVESEIEHLREERSDLYYAITVLWSFTKSWIARNWRFR